MRTGTASTRTAAVAVARRIGAAQRALACYGLPSPALTGRSPPVVVAYITDSHQGGAS